jgi:hypothetical protein
MPNDPVPVSETPSRATKTGIFRRPVDGTTFPLS